MARRVALVTGASYGVGAATAVSLASDGFDVVVSATELENLAGVMTRFESMGWRAMPVVLDLRTQSSIEHAMTEAISAFGHLDVLVNNAGANLSKPATEVTSAEWDAVIGTNLTGTFFMAQQIGRYLIGSGRPGCIVNIASVHGLVGAAGRSTYGISKAAIIHMTRMLAIEWAGYGIRVNAIAPGRMDTPSPSRAATAANPSYMAAMLDRIPLHRLVTVEEVAAATCYLASPQAASITGQTLILDGGLTVA
jgi:NAD(P)-dependent dehydrogenase (short-subunit alcohol dehydrogenase family)